MVKHNFPFIFHKFNVSQERCSNFESICRAAAENQAMETATRIRSLAKEDEG